MICGCVVIVLNKRTPPMPPTQKGKSGTLWIRCQQSVVFVVAVVFQILKPFFLFFFFKKFTELMKIELECIIKM